VIDSTWWVLGSKPFRAGSCSSIEATTDGGVQWAPLPSPPTPLATFRRPGGISQLRFADPRDGYAFGPQLWITHDGAHTWRRSPLSGHIGELAAADGYVYAVVGHGRNQRLLRSPVDRDD
jgi:photosystem II stability/assembly factor-like uncharacterized protein